MFVISTNVAETSLPIPNIKYVVDSGKEKKKVQIYKNKMVEGYYVANIVDFVEDNVGNILHFNQ